MYRIITQQHLPGNTMLITNRATYGRDRRRCPHGHCTAVMPGNTQEAINIKKIFALFLLRTLYIIKTHKLKILTTRGSHFRKWNKGTFIVFYSTTVRQRRPDGTLVVTAERAVQAIPVGYINPFLYITFIRYDVLYRLLEILFVLTLDLKKLNAIIDYSRTKNGITNSKSNNILRTV